MDLVFFKEYGFNFVEINEECQSANEDNSATDESYNKTTTNYGVSLGLTKYWNQVSINVVKENMNEVIVFGINCFKLERL